MSVSRSYARALYEAAIEAKTTGVSLEIIESQLSAVADLVESSKQLRNVLFTPATATRDKIAVVSEIAKKAEYSSLLSNFLALLARRERLKLLSEIRTAFLQVRIEAEGGVLGHLVSADPMDSADVEGISKAFTKKLGKRVVFRASTDPEMMAGMKVTVNGVTYDGTLRSQLQQLRDQLVYGTSATH